MLHIPKVRAWSNTVKKGELRLSDIDLYVLRDRPEILDALGRKRSDSDNNKTSSLNHLAVVLRGLVLLAPALSMIAFGGPIPGNNVHVVDPMKGNIAVIYTAICFLIALPGPALVTYRWWRSNRHWEWTEIIYLSSTLVFAGLILLAMTTAWDVAVLTESTMPVWLTSVMATITLVVMIAMSRGRRSPADLQFRVVGPTETDNLAQRVSELPPRVHEQLLDMRSRALGVLRKRGLIDDSQVQRFESVPLGTSLMLD